MKKTYFTPVTVISFCESIHILAGSTKIKTQSGPPITDGGEATSEDFEFSNRSLWDDEE